MYPTELLDANIELLPCPFAGCGCSETFDTEQTIVPDDDYLNHFPHELAADGLLGRMTRAYAAPEPDDECDLSPAEFAACVKEELPVLRYGAHGFVAFTCPTGAAPAPESEYVINVYQPGPMKTFKGPTWRKVLACLCEAYGSPQQVGSGKVG